MDEVSVVLRLSLMWMALGLLLGLLLRKQFQGRYVSTVFMLTYLPWLAHLLYMIWLNNALTSEEQLIYLLLSSFLALATLWVGLRSVQREGWTYLFLPLLHALLYSVGPLGWLDSVTLTQFVGNLDFVVFLGGTLFVSALLLGFRLPLRRLEPRS